VNALRVAWVDPQQCIGCTRCIDACPFDAIIGLAEHNHIILPDYCTECVLCLPVCPVDCILWREDPQHPERNHDYRIRARDRAIARKQRQANQDATTTRRLESAHERFRQSDAHARKKAIDDAIARARNDARS